MTDEDNKNIPWDDVQVVFNSNVGHGWNAKTMRTFVEAHKMPEGWRCTGAYQTLLPAPKDMQSVRFCFRVVGPVRAGDGALVRSYINNLSIIKVSP